MIVIVWKQIVYIYARHRLPDEKEFSLILFKAGRSALTASEIRRLYVQTELNSAALSKLIIPA